MALTPAERQARRRERLKVMRKGARDDANHYADTGAFRKFLQTDMDAKEYLELIDANFGVAGQTCPSLETMELNQIDPALGMASLIEYAEHLVGIWRENAEMLARAINKFKLAQLEKAQRDLETRDLSTPEDRTKAFEEAVELKSLITALKGETRMRFPAIAVKGGKAV